MEPDAPADASSESNAGRPKHVAIIMDGNGRWAQVQGLPRVEGHRRGVETVRMVSESCTELGIEVLTLYCLSSENWKRPQEELTFLMHLLEQYLIEERRTIMEQGLRLKVIGRRDRLPESVLKEMDTTLAMSAENPGTQLVLAIDYGGRDELANAARQICRDVRDGQLKETEITEETIESRLHTAGLPDVDLMIRTGGEMRVSNFLLWQISYAELFVTQTCWPAFSRGEFERCLGELCRTRPAIRRTFRWSLVSLSGRRRRMLVDRLRTSAILVSITITLVVLDCFAYVRGLEGIWLLPLLIFFSIGTAWEISSILLSSGHVIRRSIAVIGAGVVTMSGTIPLFWFLAEGGYPSDCPVGRLGWIPLIAVMTIFGILLSEMRYFDRTMLTLDSDTAAQEGKSIAGETIQRTCAAMFVSMYVGLPMAMLVATRLMHADTTSGRFGLAAIITLLVVTKVTDAGAFFAGRSFGKRKLIPSLSPAKTVEGAIGGIVAASLAAYLCLEFLFPWLMAGKTDTTSLGATTDTSGLSAMLSTPLRGALVLGPAIAISAMVGDLAESLFKRDAGVKDSGSLLPGLGGVWDVTDSLLAASVPAFFCFAAGVGGQ